MLKTVQFPIKGTFYYAADLALESEWLPTNRPLIFKAEPDNPYHVHAIQIWCRNPDKSNASELLLGYVPRKLANQLTPYLKTRYPFHPKVTHCAKVGKRIEIDCQIQLNLSWLNTLKIQLLCFWMKQQQIFKRFKKRFKNT